jgi:hypothetical protein
MTTHEPTGPHERAARLVWVPLRDPRADLERRTRAARRAGLIQAGAGLVAAALLFWLVGRLPALIAASVSIVVATLAIASPLGGLAKVERGVGRFAAVVGGAVGWLLMTPVYYLVVTPLGVLLRLRGRLRIRRGPDSSAPTYWRDLAPNPPGTAPYEKQF